MTFQPAIDRKSPTGMAFFLFGRVWVDSVLRLNIRQIAGRVGRRLRYQFAYPWMAQFLYPRKDFYPSEGKILAGYSFPENYTRGERERKYLLKETKEILENHFAFINKSEILGGRVDWETAPEEDPLWRENLHYGEWALKLAQEFRETPEDVLRDTTIRLIADWIEHNPVGRGSGWMPYTLSRRLVFWSRTAFALREDPKWRGFWESSLAPSLHQQARFLGRNLEKDLANNHLLANYRALAWMGLLFPDWPEAPAWRTIGLQGLWAEMRRQILSDGVHDERSISYHTIVLQDLLEVWRLCLAVKEPVPDDVIPTLEKMFQFLFCMQARDGSYPMLNDTVPNYPADPRSVLLAGGLLLNRPEWVRRAEKGDASYAAWLMGKNSFAPREREEVKELPAAAVYPHAGYVVLRSKTDDLVYFDAGPMGPSHLPGHGHADALSFALFAQGRWLIVDPGVFSYHDKAWRDHFRSTQAHNTVAIDGQDQCVFWGPFRVAYPPAARLLQWSEDEVSGEHEGYCRLKNPLVHRRHIKEVGPGEWEINDSFLGRGEHDFLFNLQLAPGGYGEVSGLNGEIRWPEGIALKVICLSSLPDAEARLEPGWVSFGWNLKEESPRYVLGWKGQAPCENRMILKVIKK